MAKRTFVLAIIDGWGLGKADVSNPIHVVKPATITYLKSHFPCGALQASGIAVGLPWGEEGNSEVGHLTIGAGKILYQYFPRINIAIDNGSFFKNQAFLQAIDHVKRNNSSLHLAGVLAQSNVHASLGHLVALIKLARDNGLEGRIYLHLFADGKDSPPKSVLSLLDKIYSGAHNEGVGSRLASLSGRYYAMERDKHWDRTQLAYDALVGKATIIPDVKSFVESNYQKGLVDEFLQPVIIGPEVHSVRDNDALIFFNYREDSIRQLAEAFLNPQFKNFPTVPLKDLFVVTISQYFDAFPAAVAFPSDKIETPLGKVLADNHKLQLRIAETEKYAHVTYFFNGLKDAILPNEYRVLIPSKTVAHHDEKPEMMANEITNRIIQTIQDGEMDFVLVNYANADVIAHTGNYDAAAQAIRVLDQELARLVKAVLQYNAVLIITADHGNVEQMIDPLTGVPETKHNPSPVPIYLVAKEFEKQKTPEMIEESEEETIGLLSDVAPTILELMGIAKPLEMNGESLLKKFV